ncbi:MAG: response regulator [Rivularia sp. (in: cyanobacteria)]
MRILIVEDDELISEPIVKALGEQHYTVDVTEDGQAGWELASGVKYDLIILDVMLPKLDGISLIRKVRSHNILSPIILLTAQEGSTNKVIALDAGADDYVTKPFDLQEFLARIRALLRRGNPGLPPQLEWGELHLDPSICQVTYKEQPLSLTPKEYSLLELFLRNPHRVFSLDAIIEQLWTFEEVPEGNTVRAHIKGLRMKLKKGGVTQNPVETIYGIGYRLRNQDNRVKKLDKPRKKIVNDNQKSLSMPKTSSVEEKLHSITANVWTKSKKKLNNLLIPIEEATTLVLQDRFDDELFSTAYQNAHKLKGSLGMFGFKHGSYLAGEIEDLLLSKASLVQKQKLYLSELIIALRQELQLAINNDSDFSSSNKRPLILIIERDGSLVKELCKSVANSGMRCQAAANPEAARKLILQQTPDAVILEITDENNVEGLKLLAELNCHTPTIPVLVLTTEDDLHYRVRIARLGGEAFLPKPANTALILETINNLLQPKSKVKNRILIVDDDSEVLNILSNFLGQEGFEVSTLDNPLKFWETLSAIQPNVLVLDVIMPSLSGIELCQVVRNDPRTSGLLILFISANIDAETMQRVFAAGADDYLPKPIVGSELLSRISHRLERMG